MLTQVEFVDIIAMRAIAGTPDTVVVSMLDHTEELLRPSFDGFADALVLQFEDQEERFPAGHPLFQPWPDEPTELEHSKLSHTGQGQIPALSHARAIVDFLMRHHRDPAPKKLLVHCYGGISRSAAVASWVAVRFWAPLATSRSTDEANHRLLRLLDKANAAL